jgi:hypothetical protein
MMKLKSDLLADESADDSSFYATCAHLYVVNLLS